MEIGSKKGKEALFKEVDQRMVSICNEFHFPHFLGHSLLKLVMLVPLINLSQCSDHLDIFVGHVEAGIGGGE